MGKAGPKPRPTALKALMGNPGRRPLSKAEVKPTGRPKCPRWLGKIGRHYWKRVMESMPPDFITAVDGQLLSQYCDAWQDFHEAREDIALRGTTVMSGKMEVPNPSLNRKFKARDAIRRLAANFGFSPADRVGLEFGESEEDGDPLVEMMRARSGEN
jgi:P27 family predicted phage terminase small subunit